MNRVVNVLLGKQTIMRPFIIGVLLLTISLSINGCATLFEVESESNSGLQAIATESIPLPNHSLQQSDVNEGYWWYIQFFITWPEGTDTAWYMDELIAHRVIQSVLVQNNTRIGLWRFHRRAVRDKAGHLFSLLIYSSKESAENVLAQINGDKLLQQLVAVGMVNRVTMSESDKDPKMKKIEATSDKSWALAIQQTWPYFIMGVSESWLRLIDNVAQKNPLSESGGNTQDLLVYYAKLHDDLTQIWQQQGGHAYLHHLNAIFSYEQTFIYERKLMRF